VEEAVLHLVGKMKLAKHAQLSAFNNFFKLICSCDLLMIIGPAAAMSAGPIPPPLTDLPTLCESLYSFYPVEK